MNNLVIVESPTKARTLAKFLGDEYQIEASMGHVRDLPKSDIGVDIENNFEPRYIIPKDKSKRINILKKTISEAKTLWLATDPDREGEAIAWHLAELAKSVKREAKSEKQEIKRVEFHEITEGAIKEAFKEPRGIDLRLVDAQQGRRILDRLVGYKLSPLLWKKIKSGLSAGRVQSVALRLIVEREKEIKAFNPVEYWSVEVELEPSVKREASSFLAQLVQLNGKKLEIKSKTESDIHSKVLQEASYSVSEVNKKETKRYPSPPFTTSTLQQTASNKLGFTSKKTMMLAQNLYEQGMITYMRTDSVNLAPVAISAAREVIKDVYGDRYLPATPRIFKTKSKSAQEAHEAIRPTNTRVKDEDLGTMNGVTRDHMRLYDLIWKRMMASQMSEAVLDQTSVGVSAESAGSVYQLRATGSVIKFDGWLKVYGGIQSQKPKVKSQNEESEEDEDNQEEKVLPELESGQDLSLIQLLPEQHFTQPPPRFTEASMIKKLEELGIGRPSTYAPTLSTIQERYYVERLERKFVPTDLGTTVIDFLMEHFPDIVDYSFTAEMEEKLDSVAAGNIKWQPAISEFYKPFSLKVDSTLETAQRVSLAVETVDENCPDCGKQLVIKHGKFGKFLACSGFPDCKFTKAFEIKIDVKCPKCSSGDVIVKRTKKGKPFYGCSNYPKCDFASWNRPGPSGTAAPDKS